ncbi:hypothetical protein DJFAAGMI_00431 [Comamonas sp. PE63]|uniref:TonB-dependent receptor n=1 Tax=Comamonas brasiliensis TaxID=1812482 RepID=A0ABS5LML0_9BURK|nr:TonB-dependent receptor [Comamonas sp. PE63]MBS3017708.1 hypothetical protein [Comamonas sp. PE63]
MRHFYHALGLATFLLASLGTAQAHQVWLENNGGHAQLFFGEFNDNLRETSPGALDKFLGTPTLAQQTASGTQQLSGQRNATGFSYNAASQAQTLFASAAYPLIDRSKRNEPALLWVPAARWVATPAQAVAANAQALDLVPTGKPGQLMVSFNGMALPKTKVQIVAPPGWSREAQSDEQGRVNFALPWKGLYVAEVHHSHKQGGEAQGKSYGEASYVTTLSFSIEDGMPSPVLPAAAKP